MKLEVTVTKSKDIFQKILNRIQASPNDELKIGFFSEDFYTEPDEPVYVAQVAAWNDKGTPKIPPRPFMSEGLRSLLKSIPYKKMYKSYLIQVLKGKLTIRGMYQKIGEFASEDLKQIIDAWSRPPNSARTIEVKGFNDPLIHTGQMRDSVKFKIGATRKKRTPYKMRRRPSRVR